MPTGKRGRPRKAKQVVDEDPDYATVHKTRQGARVVKVECKVVHGNEKSISKHLASSHRCTLNAMAAKIADHQWTFDKLPAFPAM